ncbi:MAG TPA: peptide chain release factor 2 [Spirochaetota bacterium]|nr:peptide chain release factor 2 [Spirochaetota bacterium]
MKDFREIKRELEGIKNDIAEFYESLELASFKEQLAKLERETQDGSFWQNVEKATQVNQEISRLKKKVEPWDVLRREVEETLDLMEIAMEENDAEVLGEISGREEEFRNRFDMLETLELLSGEDDANNAFINIHPGAGGTESQDWASMLLRMYLRWAEKHGLQTDIIDYTPGEEAGIKSSTVLIKGENSYGLLKCERGIHRLVRISPFDANKRRHTSFAAVDVIPEVDEKIDVAIDESDLRIDTYRSSGAGGQHVNKTDSAVRITHLPTGIVVQCQNERSQHKNKAFAMKVLKSKLYELKRKELEDKKTEKAGEKKDISWGNQIRSYVFQPYTLVKDHRTGQEMGAVDNVLDGSIDTFIYSYLKGLRRGDL